MQKRPSTKALILESHRFAWSNRDWILEYAKPLIIPIVLLAAVYEIGIIYSVWFEVIDTMSLYFYGVFSLMWHRAILMGFKKELVVDPFKLKPGDGRFISIVLMLWALILSSFYLIGYPLGRAAAIAENLDSLYQFFRFFLMLYLPAFFIVCLIKVMPHYFKLPAGSVGHSISYKEAKVLSRGLIMPFIVSCGLITLVGVIFVLLLYYIPFILMSIFFLDGTLPFAIGMLFLSSIPMIFLLFYIGAVNSGILSRLYQWSVQERG